VKLEKKKTISLPTGVLGLAGRPDGSRLYAACMDGRVYEVIPETDTVTAFAESHASFASGCVLLPDGATLISGGYDGCLCWHDTAQRTLVRRVKAHDFWSWQLALSNDGRHLASSSGQFLAGTEKYEPAAGTSPTLKLYDTTTGELLHALDHLPPVQSTTISPDGKLVAAANMMGMVGVWEVGTGKSVAQFKSGDFTSWGIIKSPHYLGGIFGLAFSPDCQSLLFCGMGEMRDPMAGNGKMTWQRWAWSETPARLQSQISSGDQGSGLMETIGYAPDHKSFLMAGRQAQGNWNAALFSETDGKLLASLDTKSRITRHFFTADGSTLYLGSTISQPARKDGKWPNYGQIHLVKITDAAV
jgi:WD40 repeat protein